MTKRILITGAAGFIGFHIAQALAKRGDKVLGYDNFNDYYSPDLKRERSRLLQTVGINIVDGDLCNSPLLNATFNSLQPTHIVHLAAQAGVRYSLTNPQAYIKSNVEGFVQILEACRLSPSVPLIYASSSSVYGLNQKVPFSIEDQTDQPASLYGATKKTNELLASTYHHLYKIPVTGLRFFTVYGPWGRPDMAYFQFTKAILAGETIPVFNYGHMERDFTYVDDIVQGTIAAIDLAAPCELFNLGNHQPIALLDMIHLLERLLNKPAKMQLLPMQPGDVTKTYADISHSSAKLNYIPKTSLEEGLTKFIEWYQIY